MVDENDLAALPGVESVSTSFNGSVGGFKQVYRCRVNGHDDAVKITKIADRAVLNETTLRRLRREIELLSALSSPYLPKLGSLSVQRLDKSNSTFILYSEEFIEGSDVSELITNEFFADPAQINRLLHDATSAIQVYWHHDRTVHRDIKPANIRFANTSNKFLLIDAGIALVKEQTTITPTGSGSPRTPLYAAPEVIRGQRNLSFKTDLFSLGVVLYESASGVHPFYTDGMTIHELESSILSSEPEDIERLRADLAPGVAAAIMKMLQKRPHQRPRDLGELIKLGGD